MPPAPEAFEQTGFERGNDGGVDAERHVGDALHQLDGLGQHAGLIRQRDTGVHVQHVGTGFQSMVFNTALCFALAVRGLRQAEGLRTPWSRMGLDLVTGAPSSQTSRLIAGAKVRRQDLINFCFHMEQMTGAGVPFGAKTAFHALT